MLRLVEEELAWGDTGNGAMEDWKEIVQAVQAVEVVEVVEKRLGLDA